MKSFHPHGDSSIYDTLVRMAQTFSLRYPLVDPQGNFGNIDGYSAAAMRYTECRLAPIATELLRDIDADTVDFGPNYDESRREPTVLPSRFPNLLVNGSSGIAVGMATNMPPHNLGEVVDAIVAHDRRPGDRRRPADPAREGARLPDGRHHPRPRRDPRGLPLGPRPDHHARPRPHRRAARRQDGDHRQRASLRRAQGRRRRRDHARSPSSSSENVLSEISGIKDLSDKSGMRIQIELKREAIPQVVLNKLYKHTPLQSTFGYNAVALVDGVPRTLSLLELIRHYLNHQRDVVTRRLKYELRNAVRRAHILEGYLIALDNIDAVISLIRASDSTDAARTGLMDSFGLSELQAQAILDMRLARLTGLARKEIRRSSATSRSASARFATSSATRRRSTG